VTVGQAQAGAVRDRIGRIDCSDRPVVAAADLIGCDEVGAHLGNAQVSADGRGTRLETANLSGAELGGADLTRADIAGGRINDADASGANIDRMSFAHTEALGFIAKQTVFQGANLYDVRMRDAQLNGARFENQTSLTRADLTDSDMTGGVRIVGSVMDSARLVGTDLHKALLQGVQPYFADFTRAKLRGATIINQKAILQWALLCNTEMPTVAADDDADRDCTGPPPGPGPKPPAGTPFVRVDARLDNGDTEATIDATVHWNAPGGGRRAARRRRASRRGERAYQRADRAGREVNGRRLRRS